MLPVINIDDDWLESLIVLSFFCWDEKLLRGMFQDWIRMLHDDDRFFLILYLCENLFTMLLIFYYLLMIIDLIIFDLQFYWNCRSTLNISKIVFKSKKISYAEETRHRASSSSKTDNSTEEVFIGIGIGITLIEWKKNERIINGR